MQTGGPDAPFQLELLTSVQPHKHMAVKMGKCGSVMNKGPNEVDGISEEANEMDVYETSGADKRSHAFKKHKNKA